MTEGSYNPEIKLKFNKITALILTIDIYCFELILTVIQGDIGILKG